MSSWATLEDALHSWWGKPERTLLQDEAQKKRTERANEERWKNVPWKTQIRTSTPPAEDPKPPQS